MDGEQKVMTDKLKLCHLVIVMWMLRRRLHTYVKLAVPDVKIRTGDESKKVLKSLTKSMLLDKPFQFSAGQYCY